MNLAMKRAGFGFNESAGWNYAAMWVDESRDSTPTFDFITFPAKGYHPTSFFGADWAWSVNVNEGKYSTPVKGQIKVTVSRKSDSSLQPLKLNYLNVSTEKRGASGPCIIFRPESVSVQNGAIYEVEITGLKTQGGQNSTIKYLVEFFELTSAKEKK